MKSKNTVGRREFILTGLAAPALPLISGVRSLVPAVGSGLGIPGPYRGRVIAVRHEGSIVSGVFQAEPIRSMMHRGMAVLTGANDWAGAWRVFFEPGDVVGIKVNPVGAPHVMSSAEVIHQIVDGLKTAGVKPGDIIVFDRYRRDFLQAGFGKMIPEGVRLSSASDHYDLVQLDMDGYDPDHYMEMALVTPGQDAANPHARRSYVARLVTREINKLINLPVLKDHQSAGVTLSLKNLSHGLVNNVYRSHSTPTLNACGTFIPAVVSIPVIRQKTVLHILDGIKALYHGGPGSDDRFVWEHKTVYFATDPVALDRIGWKAIDEKRLQAGMSIVAESKPDPPHSNFLRRQPEHIEIAGALGLGEWEENRIDLKRFDLT